MPIPTKLQSLYKRLECVNTELNAIEELWPHQLPTDNKIKQLKFSFDPQRLPQRAVRSIEQQAQRLADNCPGWKVTVHIYAFTGQDAGCVINVSFNGSSAGRTGCHVYNHDLGVKSKSYTASLNACVEQWPAEVDRLIAKFKGFSIKPFQTKRYKSLYRLRQQLNQEWHAKAPTLNCPYPYGAHVKNWPTG